MVPLWFTLSALCFVGAGVLLYADLDQRRGRGRRRRSWARSHGFDYEAESEGLLKRWKRGVIATVGDVAARNVVLGQIRGEAVYVFDIEEVATVIALHRKAATNVVVDLRLKGFKEPRENDIWQLGAIGPRMVYSTNLDAARRACDRRMVAFAHSVPDTIEIMWNEPNWTLVCMPVASGRADWDEGLRTVRQLSDLLRVLPPATAKTEKRTKSRAAKTEPTATGATRTRRTGESGRSAAEIESSGARQAVAPPSAAKTRGNPAPPPAPRPVRRPDSAVRAGRNGRSTAHHQG